MTESLLTTYDSLLFDLDGTVWEGGSLLPHAQRYLTTVSVPVMYITNNASRGPEVVAEMLTKLGVPTDERHVVTSAQAAVEFAQQRLQPGDPVYVLGSESFKNLARHGGFRVVDSADDNPKAVFHGHNPETGWAELSEAALSIRNGAYYFASNLDTTLPMERGLMVGNGSMVAAVTTATGVTPLSAGKPEPAMFHSAAAKVQSTRPLAVGDRLNTDIAGGVAANMDTFHVLTGVSRHWALVHAEPAERPTYIAEDLRGLDLPAAELAPHAQAGFAARRADNNTIVLTSGDTFGGGAVEALRTVLAVAWADSSAGFAGEVVPADAGAERALAGWQ